MVTARGGQMRVRMVMKQQKREIGEALITGMTPTVTISTFKLSLPDLYFSFLNHLPAVKKLLAGASILCLTYEYLPVFILNKFRFDYHLMRGNQDSGILYEAVLPEY